MERVYSKLGSGDVLENTEQFSVYQKITKQALAIINRNDYIKNRLISFFNKESQEFKSLKLSDASNISNSELLSILKNSGYENFEFFTKIEGFILEYNKIYEDLFKAYMEIKKNPDENLNEKEEIVKALKLIIKNLQDIFGKEEVLKYKNDNNFSFTEFTQDIFTIKSQKKSPSFSNSESSDKNPKFNNEIENYVKIAKSLYIKIIQRQMKKLISDFSENNAPDILKNIDVSISEEIDFFCKTEKLEIKSQKTLKMLFSATNNKKIFDILGKNSVEYLDELLEDFDNIDLNNNNVNKFIDKWTKDIQNDINEISLNVGYNPYRKPK